MAVSIRFNTTDFERAVQQLRDRAPIAIVRALNRSIGSAKTLLVRDTAADMKLRVGDVRDAVTVSNASPANHAVQLHASSKQIPAIAFGARGPEPSRGRGRGVTARLPGGRYPHAFIATIRGRRGVYQRRGRARIPIAQLRGPSVAHVAQKHVPAALERGVEQLHKNLEHEFKFALSQK